MTEMHRQFIRQLPCTICGDNTTVECAHIRFADPRIAKPITGMQIKPPDHFTVPLCGIHHRTQHDSGDERVFWALGGIDPILVALALYAVSGDYEQGTKIIEAAHA